MFIVFQIPFFPVITKDLTFIHLGNDSIVDGLVCWNFNFFFLRLSVENPKFNTTNRINRK